jgi:hypothetical protein
MSRRPLAAAALAALLWAGCRKEPERGAATAAHVPKGDVIWLVDRGAAADPTLDGELGRIGAAAVFLPAGTLGASAGPAGFEPAPFPPKPFEHVATVLVVSPAEALAGALTSSDGPEAEPLGSSAASALSRVIAGGAYGRVAGVHLDFPFAPRAAARYGALVAALKHGLPPGTFVSISLKAIPSAAEDRKKLAPLLEAADALVAFIFGTGPRVDPIATDALHRPWWAAYDTRTAGEIRGADGQPRGSVPGRLVEPLSGSGRFQFENDLSVNDASVSAFALTARAPVRQDGLVLEPGDRIAFRLPAVSEMLFQLGSNLAGKRYALGRALLFEGATEAERVFDLAALEDVLLGRSLAPALEASVAPAGRGAVAVDLVNRNHHASVVSRVDNWVEVDLAPAHPADVQLGGFDRYEVYDRSGRPVTPGRATTVRLFETLVAPLETITPARIVVRGPLPAGCCPYRVHAMSAAGPEVATDWQTPPAPPTPEPKKAAPSRKKK